MGCGQYSTYLRRKRQHASMTKEEKECEKTKQHLRYLSHKKTKDLNSINHMKEVAEKKEEAKAEVKP